VESVYSTLVPLWKDDSELFSIARQELFSSVVGDAMDKLLARQGEVQERLDALDAWDLDSRLELAMDALRCPPGDTPIGGMVYVRPKQPEKYPASRWVGFISVGDVATAATLVEKEGGKVLVSPRKAGDRGTEALLVDPEGGMFGVIHSATGDPEDYLAGNDQWLWAELWAGDAAKMAAFYKGIGPYELRDGAAKGEGAGFQLWSGGYARAGIMPKPENVPTTWLAYVRVKSVADTVARASEAGGTIYLQPTPLHGTTMAVIIDPTGAPFAVAEWPAVATEAAR